MTNEAALPRYDYYKGPQRLGDRWTLRRGTAVSTCTLATHSLGWELRLTSGANLLRSQVCKADAEVLNTSQAWEAEAKTKGWG